MSSCTNIRHTVGGAQSVVTLFSRDRIQHATRVEPRLIGDEHGGTGVPRREEAAIGVLRPAGRGNVQVHVARLQADPVHGDQVADRIALVAVLHQLRPRRGAGGEIQQHRIGGPRLAIWRRSAHRRAADRRSHANRPGHRRPRCGSPSDRGRRTSAHRLHWRSDGGHGRARSGPSGRSASAAWSPGSPRRQASSPPASPPTAARRCRASAGCARRASRRARAVRWRCGWSAPTVRRRCAVAAPSPTIFSARRFAFSPRANSASNQSSA